MLVRRFSKRILIFTLQNRDNVIDLFRGFFYFNFGWQVGVKTCDIQVLDIIQDVSMTGIKTKFAFVFPEN